ncbi:hypothetical protein VB005_02441 [Metarhizium brunneum]
MADADSVYEGLADAKNMMPPHPSFAKLPAELRRLVVSYLVQHWIVQHWCIASTVKLRPMFWKGNGKSYRTMMTAIIVNNGNTTGLSACLDAGSGSSLLAHKRDQRATSSTAGSKPRDTWLYMPLAPEEWLRDVWVRHDTLFGKMFTCVTSKSRVYMLAEHPIPGQELRYKYQPIARLQNKATTLCFDLTNGVRAVSVSSPESTDPQEPLPPSPPCPPRPVSAYPHTVSPEMFFYSFAMLENVSELKLCRVGDTITGMVLRYSDSTEASLGWVRRETLRSMQKEDDSSGLWLLISISSGFPRVSDIRLTLPSANEGKYFAMQWCGKLEWWFSRRQCQLRYEGISTLEPRCQVV